MIRAILVDDEPINISNLKALLARHCQDIDVIATAQQFNNARAILLDTYRADVAGGTGEIFDWRRVPNSLRDKIVLAGGLTRSSGGQNRRRPRRHAPRLSARRKSCKKSRAVGPARTSAATT